MQFLTNCFARGILIDVEEEANCIVAFDWWKNRMLQIDGIKMRVYTGKAYRDLAKDAYTPNE